MVKVKTFGVIRSTTGLGCLEIDTANVQGIFDEISALMKKAYYEDKKEDLSERHAALIPHKELKFGDAVVYVNGERCMRKKKKLSDGDEVWLLSPAAGG